MVIINKNKRLKATLFCLVINYCIVTYGIYCGANITELGTGLTLLNVPLYAFIFGDTVRPSIENTQFKTHGKVETRGCTNSSK